MDTETTSTSNDVIHQFLAYPFDTDDTYQQGLAGILKGSQFLDQTSEAKEDLILRSRVFYFNRITGSSIDADDVRPHVPQAHHAAPTITSQPGLTPVSESSVAEEPRTLTFAELKELIEQGKTDQIPNNRVIPDTLSEDPPSSSTAPVRKKPWET